MRRAVLALLLLAVVPPALPAAPDFARERDVIYGRKYGLALTMDVFTPAKANGLGVIAVVSGGWRSAPEAIVPGFYYELLGRGYTVFAVVHGSQPRFTLLDIRQDMDRAVRFVRANAAKHAIDPDRIGMTGASAGAHLSLLQGTAGGPGDPRARDPIDRVSSRVQCVGCFFPPTDFLNYGRKGNELIDRALNPPFTAAVDYQEYDPKTARFVPITDEARLREIARRMSPAWQVTPESAPALLIHGDKDDLVPLQQSEWMMERLKSAGVPCELVVRKGEGHGWLGIPADMKLIADWFDAHLARKAKKAG